MIVSAKDPIIQTLLKQAGVNSRKHKTIVTVTQRVTCSGTYWDGGSRSSYILVQDGRPVDIPSTGAPQFNGGRPETVLELDADTYAVCVGTFAGKPATPSVYLHPALAKQLNLEA